MGKRNEQTLHKKGIKMALNHRQSAQTHSSLEKCKLQHYWATISHLSDWQKVTSMTQHSAGEAVAGAGALTHHCGMQMDTTLWEGKGVIRNTAPVLFTWTQQIPLLGIVFWRHTSNKTKTLGPRWFIAIAYHCKMLETQYKCPNIGK